jgi:hypothetical protein
LLEVRKVIKRLQEENEALKNQQAQLIQEEKSGTQQAPLADPVKGLTKVMVDLSVKEMELGTMTSQLKNKYARVEELEDQEREKSFF